METSHAWNNAQKCDVKLTINQRKIYASCKQVVISIIISVPMVVARFSKNKITFVLLNHVFFVLIRGLFQIKLKVRIGVFLNKETDLALAIHFHLPNTQLGLLVNNMVCLWPELCSKFHFASPQRSMKCLFQKFNKP